MTEKSLEEVGNDRLVDVTKVYTICVDIASSHVGDVMFFYCDCGRVQ